MNNLIKDIRAQLKDRVVLDREDKAALVTTVANKVILEGIDIYTAISDSI